MAMRFVDCYHKTSSPCWFDLQTNTFINGLKAQVLGSRLRQSTTFEFIPVEAGIRGELWGHDVIVYGYVYTL